MRRVIYLFIFMIIALVLPVFLLVSCTKDEGTGPLTDSSSWEVLTTGELEVPGAVWALDTDEAIVGADNEHIYLTEDNGYNWTTKTLDTETGRNATDFYFIPGGNGIMIGERGMIYVSTDEGQNWTDATPSEMRDENLYDIIYPSDGSGNPLFVVGDDGALLRSTNYGITWEMISFDTLFYSDTLGNSSWYYDTTTFESQKFIDFHGGFAPNSNLIYILADTSTTDRKVILFRSTTGDADDWDTLAINTPLTLVDLYMSDDNSGFTISDDGYVYPITIDSTTVTLDPMPAADIGRALKEIEFIDDNTGWVVGASGAVARTSDGGENWEEIDVDITGDVYDIAFADADQGWIVGNDEFRGTGAIKITLDGGDTWLFRSYGLGLSLNGVHFISADEGWIVGKSGRIAHTTDGGYIWTHQDANTQRTFQDVYFANSNDGWAVGFSFKSEDNVDTFATILYTTDGGEHWNAVDSLYGYRLNKVEFTGTNTGWAVGDKGLILKSNDGGLTWNRQESNVSAELFGLDIRSADEIFVVGQHGTILHTTDGGETWNQQTSNTEQSIMDIDFVNSSTGYVCGSMGTIMKTTDGGVHWATLDLPEYCGAVYKSVAFSSSDIGWIVGNSGYIMHTIDGGETWYRQEEGLFDDTLNEIFILDSSHAWIVGDNNVIMRLNPGE